MRYLLTLSLLLLLGVASVHAQSVKSVEYDFSSQALKGAVPFDQPFTIRFTHVSDSVKFLNVEIFEIRRIDYNKLVKNVANRTFTLETLKKNPEACPFIYSQDTIFQPRTVINGEVSMAVPISLLPNSCYFIQIKGGIDAPVTEEERETVIAAMMEDKDLQAVLNKVIVKNIKGQASVATRPKDFSDITNAANTAVQKINPQYVITSKNYEDQFLEVSKMFGQAGAITGAVASAKNTFYMELIGSLNQRITRNESDSTSTSAFILVKTHQAAAAKDKLHNLTAKDAGLSPAERKKNDAAISKANTAWTTEQNSLDSARQLLDPKVAELKQLRLAVGGLYKANAMAAAHPPLKNLSRSSAAYIDTVNWLNVENVPLSDYIKSDFAAEKVPLLSQDIIDKAATSAQVVFNTDADNPLDKMKECRDNFKRGMMLEFQKYLFLRTAVGNSYPADVQERLKMHITLDLGYAYIFDVSRMRLYAGMNIYLRAIDTSLPLKNYRTTFLDYISARTSLLVGLTMQSIDKENIRKGIIGSNALMAGIGYRLLPWFKVNGGACFFYAYPTNPLVNKENYKMAATPFTSLSIDFNLSSFLSSFGNGHVANIFKP